MGIRTKAGADLYFQERGVWPKGWEPPEKPEYIPRGTPEERAASRISLQEYIDPAKKKLVYPESVSARADTSLVREKFGLFPETAPPFKPEALYQKVPEILSPEAKKTAPWLGKAVEEAKRLKEGKTGAERKEEEAKKYGAAIKENRTLMEKKSRLIKTDTITSALITPEMKKNNPVMAAGLEAMFGQKLTDEWIKDLGDEYDREMTYQRENIINPYEEKHPEKFKRAKKVIPGF